MPALFLTEMSVPAADLRAVAMATDPLVAADPGYATKIWMSSLPEGLALRPWRYANGGSGSKAMRILGWRKSKPDEAARPEAVRLGYREFELERDEVATFMGTVIPYVKRWNPHIGASCRSDAAIGWGDPDVAYLTWVKARLMGTESFMTIKEIDVSDAGKIRTLRKVARDETKLEVVGKIRRRSSGEISDTKIVRSELTPRASVTLTVKVVNPEETLRWLVAGFGPQKCFGYGGLLPC